MLDSRSDHKTSTKRLFKLMQSACAALHILNFARYIHVLDQLGEELDWLSHVYCEHGSKQAKIAWLENYLKNEIGLTITLQNPLAYCVFEEAWKDEYLKNHRTLSAKVNLKHSTRHHINLGMRALAICASVTPENPIDKKLMQHYDRKARYAIKTYRSAWQHFLFAGGKVLAFFMAVMCGMASAATIILATIQIWPSWAIVLAASLGCIATMLTNWVTCKKTVPQVLIDILGKDYLFSGWREFYDKETGVRKRLSWQRMLLLALSSLLALSVGVSGAALTYNFLARLGTISFFSFLNTIPWLNTLWLNSMAVLAAGFSICVSALMLNAFVELMRENIPLNFLFNPLREMNAIFVNESSKGYKKIMAYAALVLLTGISIFGLVAMQIQSYLSLTDFLIQRLDLISPMASTLSMVVCLGLALLGQVPFVVVSCFKAMVEFSRSLTRQSVPDEEQNSVYFYNLVQHGLSLISAAGTGSIVINTFDRRLYSWLGFTGSSWNILSGVIAAESTHKEDIERKKATSKRLANLERVNHQLTLFSKNQTATMPLPKTNLSNDKYYHQYFFSPNAHINKGDKSCRLNRLSPSL